MSEVEKNVNWGLDKIDPTRKVELPLRDAVYVAKVLGEFVSFFHQPANYPTIESVEAFLGTIEEGAYHVLHEACYKRMREIWPPDIEEMLGNGELDRNPFVDP
jgi:hypothetical protein